MGKKKGYEIKLTEKQITKISSLLDIPRKILSDWLDLDILLEKLKEKNIFPWHLINSADVRRIAGSKYLHSKIWFNDIFIEPNEYTREIIKRSVEKSTNPKELYKILQIEYNWKQLDNFLNKRNWLPLSVFEKIIQFLEIDKNIENILEKCKIRSHGGNRDIIRYNPNICLLYTSPSPRD